MPYKCVHCSEVYQDKSQEVLAGCANCKSKFFFYIKDDKFQEILKNKDIELDLSTSEKKQMEEDVRDLAGIRDEEQPVFLDFESVKVLKPGKYLIDIANLLSVEGPRVYQLEDGKYIVDLMAAIKPSEE